MSWWNRLRNRDRLEGELDAELRDHVERQVAGHVRAGLPEDEARRRARLEFGGLDQIKELCRDARGTRWVDETWQDLRFAARLLASQRSFTVVSLGAGRWRVVRQVLIECAVLAFLGVLVGGVLAMLGLRALDDAIPDGVLGYWITFDFDARVFAAMVGIGSASVILFGLVPALSVSNRSSGALRDDARAGAGRSTGRLTSVFLAAEFGLTLILLTAISNSVLRFVEDRRTFTMVDSAGVLTAEVALTADRYETPEARTAFFEDVRARLGTGSTTAAIVDALPGGGAGRTSGVRIDERPETPAELLPDVLTLTAGPGYFDAIGAPLLRGRPFSDRDGAPGAEAAIVNARFVEIHFPEEEPLGRRIGLVPTATDPPDSWLTIVGVAPTLRQRPARREPDPLVYLPSRADPPRVATLLARGPADPGATASVVRETVRRIDPGLPLFRVRTLEQALRDASWNGRMSEAILWTIAFIALVLSTAGLFAVTSHAVERRMRDLGIRIALGARPPQVSWMVLRSVVRHLVLGTVVGGRRRLRLEHVDRGRERRGRRGAPGAAAGLRAGTRRRHPRGPDGQPRPRGARGPARSDERAAKGMTVMSWWERLRNRVGIENELDAELRDHVERQVAGHARSGLSERDARRRARLEFGGLLGGASVAACVWPARRAARLDPAAALRHE